MDCLSCVWKCACWVSVSWGFTGGSNQNRKTELSLLNEISQQGCSVIDTSSVPIIRVQNLKKILIFTLPSTFISNHKLFQILKSYAPILLYITHYLTPVYQAHTPFQLQVTISFSCSKCSLVCMTFKVACNILSFSQSNGGLMDMSTESRIRMCGLNLVCIN